MIDTILSSDWRTWLTIAGLAAITALSRSFFFISSRSWALPAWAERGLQYAPIAALAAVVLPEVATTQGAMVVTWMDARLFGAAAGAACFFWKKDVLITIASGMAVYLPLRVGLGW